MNVRVVVKVFVVCLAVVTLIPCTHRMAQDVQVFVSFHPMVIAKEMASSDESFSNTGYEPKDCFLTETYVEFNHESMTEQRFPEQRFLEDGDCDDAAIGEMLFFAYREQVYHSQREGLSVGQSSSSVSDRTGQPFFETVAKSHDISHFSSAVCSVAMAKRIQQESGEE